MDRVESPMDQAIYFLQVFNLQYTHWFLAIRDVPMARAKLFRGFAAVLVLC